MKAPDLIETALSIECIEIMRVALGELAGLQITATQVRIAESVRALAREQMKTQPATVHPRDSVSFAEERYKQKQNEICIYLRLEFQIARKIFGSDLASSVFELKRGM